MEDLFSNDRTFWLFSKTKIRGDCENINPNSIASKYVFEALYDSTQSAAQQISELNRFILKGLIQVIC